MVKLSKDALSQIQFQLETVDSSWQTEYNLRDVIKECFYLIQDARKHKVSWEKITDIIKQASNITDGISPASVSKYYLELKNNPENLPKKKRKSTTLENKQNSQNQNAVAKIDVTSTAFSSTALVISPEISSDELDKPSESAIESLPQPELSTSVEKAEARSKKKFGNFYESGNKKAADEFNL